MLGYSWWQIGQMALYALLSVAKNPLLYISAVLMVWEVQRNAKFERMSFGIRVTRVWRPVLARWAIGLCGSLVLTVFCLLFGVFLNPWDVWAVTLVSMALAVLRVRFLGTVYSIGLLVIGAVAVQKWSPSTNVTWIDAIGKHLQSFQVLSWLGLAAILLMVEAALLYASRKQRFAPAVVTSKRGKPIGAFLVQLSLVLPVSSFTSGDIPLHGSLPIHWPWLGGGNGPVSLVALPLVCGLGGLFSSLKPDAAIRMKAGVSVVAGLLVALDACAVYRFGLVYGVIGGVFLLLVNELVGLCMMWSEHRSEPRYVASLQGVRILTVLEGSLADVMNLQPGEIITHVNQVPVHSAYDLHFAFDQNPAYAKLQVLDERGEVRIVGKPVYSGERNQLGLILVPEGRQEGSYRSRQVGLFQTLYLKMCRRVPIESWANADSVPPTA